MKHFISRYFILPAVSLMAAGQLFAVDLTNGSTGWFQNCCGYSYYSGVSSYCYKRTFYASAYAACEEIVSCSNQLSAVTDSPTITTLEAVSAPRLYRGTQHEATCTVRYTYPHGTYAHGLIVTNYFDPGRACRYRTETYHPATGECQNRNAGAPRQCVNNPVDPVTGYKYQTETDYTSNHLQLIRRYSSSERGGAWGFSYTQALGIYTYTSGTVIYLYRPSGEKVRFSSNADHTWTTDSDETAVLTTAYNASGRPSGYRVRWRNNDTEMYDLEGHLVSINTVSGHQYSITNHFFQTSAKLDTALIEKKRITHRQTGRYIEYRYSPNGQIQTATSPDGKFKYTYSNEVLASVSYPDDTPLDNTDNPTRQYVYENHHLPSHLTGIIDENGNRFAIWEYDHQGRAISSAHANGANKVTFRYNANGTTTVTDLLGASRTYTTAKQFGLLKVSSVAGAQCSYCSGQDQAITYDANGFVSSRTDFNGNLTTYVNNRRGLEVSRTQAFGTPQARTITTQWHETFRLPTKITAPGKQTTFTYDVNGRLLVRHEKAL